METEITEMSIEMKEAQLHLNAIHFIQGSNLICFLYKKSQYERSPQMNYFNKQIFVLNPVSIVMSFQQTKSP